MNNTGECGDVFDSGVFDYWVISHTLIPYFIYWTGIVRPLNILLLVYFWETIEMGFRHCSVGPSDWAQDEPISNSLVIDPIVAFLALLVLVLIRFRFDKSVIPTSGNFFVNIFFFLVACAPTIWFFDVFINKDLHYMFLPSAIGVMFVTKPDESFGWYDVISFLFVLAIFLTVDFSTDSNSFILTIMVCSVFIFALSLSIALKKRTFDGIQNLI